MRLSSKSLPKKCFIKIFSKSGCPKKLKKGHLIIKSRLLDIGSRACDIRKYFHRSAFCNSWSCCRGDLLRSVPCVTVWHKKIKSKTLWTGEKSIKVHLVYVPMNIKNIRGHLPDLSYKDTEVVYYGVCHTVTFSWKQSQKPLPGHKNIQISK